MVPARLAVPAALSIVGGYVDVICYIRYSTFVATMTGNLVITGQTFFEVVHAVTGPHTADEMRPAPVAIKAHIAGDVALQLVGFRIMVIFFNCVGAFGYSVLHRHAPHATARVAAPWIALMSLAPDLLLMLDPKHNRNGWPATSGVALNSSVSRTPRGGSSRPMT